MSSKLHKFKIILMKIGKIYKKTHKEPLRLEEQSAKLFYLGSNPTLCFKFLSVWCNWQTLQSPKLSDLGSNPKADVI